MWVELGLLNECLGREVWIVGFVECCVLSICFWLGCVCGVLWWRWVFWCGVEVVVVVESWWCVDVGGVVCCVCFVWWGG